MKTFKKILSVTLAALMVISCLCVSAFAAGGKISVHLRIEGIKNCLYYGSVEVENTASVLDVIKNAPGVEVTTVESEYGRYLTAINGEAEKTFKGWDGWLYTVNGEDSMLSIDKQNVNDGDSVLVYYGDPYGVGFAYPTIDTSKLSDGQLTFTTTVTTYDEEWNATTEIQNIKDYSIIWGYGDGETVTLTCDENGVVNIDGKYLEAGEHSLQISKYSAAGLPLVLRYAPDYTVTVAKKGGLSSLMYAFEKVVNFFKQIILKISDFIRSIFSSFAG